MIAASLHRAFDRIEDFLAVQRSLSVGDLTPVLRLQAAAGMDEAERAAVAQRVSALGCDERAGAILLGVLLGLFTAQFEGEVGSRSLGSVPPPLRCRAV